jgi:hypothetical protein
MKSLILFTLLLGMFFYGAQSQPTLKRAIVTPANLDSLIAYEKSFTAHYKVVAPDGTNWFKYKKGERNILLLAPHATAQSREGKIKVVDRGTGSLVVELNKLCNVHVLYTTYLSPSDPNYYDNNAFKDSLAELLQRLQPLFVIDVHASAGSRPYDVDFGTLNGISLGSKSYLLDSLIFQLHDCGITNLSSNFFSAAIHQTDTKFVYSKGFPCIQLEINSNYLRPDQGGIFRQNSAQLLQALVRFIDLIDLPK